MIDQNLMDRLLPCACSGDAPKSSNKSSNTYYQRRNIDPWNGGEDYLKVGAVARADWEIHWLILRDKLMKAKLLSIASVKNGGEPATCLVGCYTLTVMPRGHRLGNVRNGTYVSFVVLFDGLTLLFLDRNKPETNQPNVWMIASGIACLTHGAYGCLQRFRDLINQTGGGIQREFISRVDMRLDIPGIGVDELWTATRERRYAARAKLLTETEHYKKTIRFGKYPLALTIYDKVSQVNEQYYDTDSVAKVIHRCWNGVMPNKAIRVEFRIGREMLRKKGVDSPDDYFRKRGALIKYLTTKWIRFTTTPVTRGNAARTPTLPLWEDITAAFAKWAGQPNGEVLAPLPTSGPVDVTPLLKQGYGYVKAIARKRFMVPVSYEQYCDWTLDHAMELKESNQHSISCRAGDLSKEV